jgi:ubiquinone/menaquinone biosynthesis C-methylase UbiE
VRFETHVIDPEAEMAALRELGGLEGARVLEVGCGDGRLTFRYTPAARSVLAIDPCAKASPKPGTCCQWNHLNVPASR